MEDVVYKIAPPQNGTHKYRVVNRWDHRECFSGTYSECKGWIDKEAKAQS